MRFQPQGITEFVIVRVFVIPPVFVTVVPGTYSAIVSGAAGTTGDVLLEVYEVPQ